MSDAPGPGGRRRLPSSWAAVTAAGVLGVIALAGIVLTSSPTPSPSPRPIGTPVAGAWTGLDWSDAAKAPADTQVFDVMAWQGEYVGVGVHQKPDAEFGEPTFLTSRDGLDWTVAYQYSPQLNQFPTYLVPLGKGLLAVSDQGVMLGGCCSTPSLWQSDDGSTWYGIQPLGDWNIWIPDVHLVGVASRPDGVVVLGIDANDAPVVLHSTDGRHWNRVGLSSAFDLAIPTGITAYSGGFVIVGRVGEPDTVNQKGQFVGGLARPAAWWSANGVTWQAADVEGADVAGGELSQVVAGAGGLFAVGVDTVAGQPGYHGPQSGWVSADGKTWRQTVQMAARNVPAISGLAGDGAHLVLLGQDPATIGPVLAAWASTDGVTWTRLAFTGATATIPEEGRVGTLSRGLWVVPGGVVVLAATPMPQEFWYATATGH